MTVDPAIAGPAAESHREDVGAFGGLSATAAIAALSTDALGAPATDASVVALGSAAIVAGCCWSGSLGFNSGCA